MALWQALVLGVVQGFTEFLPVSSSGHLVLAERLLGLSLPGLTFEIAVHVGTLVAVVWVYAADIRRMLAALWRRDFRNDADARLALYVILGSLPTAAMGLLFKPYIEGLFDSLLAVGYFLILTGVLLWVSDMRANRAGNRGLSRGLSIPGALFIGVMQGTALAPGLSRSGATIAAGLLAGLPRVEAARFSFLLSLPAVGGAAILDLMDVGVAGAGISPALLFAGAAASAVTGFVAIKVLLQLLEARRLHLFAYYVWVLGLLVIFMGG